MENTGTLASAHNQSAGAATGKKNSKSWRVVDIIVATILAVACALLFVVWNTIGYAGFNALDALTPGFGGLVVGFWLIGGVLGGIIIRKPGAALYVEALAASLSAAMGSQWGIETLYSGLAQGLGAEIIFLLFFYKRFGLGVSMLAGAFAGVGAWTLELFLSGNIAKSVEFLVIYLGCLVVSGAVLAGLVGWLLTRGLARTGALDRFAAGREARSAASGR